MTDNAAWLVLSNVENGFLPGEAGTSARLLILSHSQACLLTLGKRASNKLNPWA